MKKIAFLLVVFAVTGFFFVKKDVMAQMQFLVDGYQDRYFQYNEGPGAEIQTGKDDNREEIAYIYEKPTVKALAYLYWALGMYETEDDWAVDEFLRLTECDLYRKFSSDEFEWSGIRDASKRYVVENKEDFPTRFSFVVPIYLSEYDQKRKGFALQKKYKVDTLRRFEFHASNYSAKPCTRDHNVMRGYPRALVMEFSRPFTLTRVPMSQDVAEDYIRARNKVFQSDYDAVNQTKENMYKYRDAYLVMKVKVFAHGKDMGLNYYRIPTVQMMGMLEGFEVYEDKALTNLFYAENYMVGRKRGKLDVRLKEQYEALRKAFEGEGTLHISF